MDKYVELLKKTALKAYKKNEVPVAAIIVKNNKVIATAYNKKNSGNNPMLHAEILAINKACKKIKDWRLNECIMYVTLEPCEMCKSIINESRIEKVIYTLNNKSLNKPTTKFTQNNKYSDYFNFLMTEFFKHKR